MILKFIPSYLNNYVLFKNRSKHFNSMQLFKFSFEYSRRVSFSFIRNGVTSLTRKCSRFTVCGLFPLYSKCIRNFQEMCTPRTFLLFYVTLKNIGSPFNLIGGRPSHPSRHSHANQLYRKRQHRHSRFDSIQLSHIDMNGGKKVKTTHISTREKVQLEQLQAIDVQSLHYVVTVIKDKYISLLATDAARCSSPPYYRSYFLFACGKAVKEVIKHVSTLN